MFVELPVRKVCCCAVDGYFAARCDVKQLEFARNFIMEVIHQHQHDRHHST